METASNEAPSGLPQPVQVPENPPTVPHGLPHAGKVSPQRPVPDQMGPPQLFRPELPPAPPTPAAVPADVPPSELIEKRQDDLHPTDGGDVVAKRLQDPVVRAVQLVRVAGRRADVEATNKRGKAGNAGLAGEPRHHLCAFVFGSGCYSDQFLLRLQHLLRLQQHMHLNKRVQVQVGNLWLALQFDREQGKPELTYVMSLGVDLLDVLPTLISMLKSRV